MSLRVGFDKELLTEQLYWVAMVMWGSIALSAMALIVGTVGVNA